MLLIVSECIYALEKQIFSCVGVIGAVCACICAHYRGTQMNMKMTDSFCMLFIHAYCTGVVAHDLQDLKNIKNVKGCRDSMPKSMQTR